MLQKGNTALHYASTSGLRKCVELLVAQGAGLFIENRDRLTPCDLAVRAAHHDVATYLESRMVFVSPLTFLGVYIFVYIVRG